MQLEVPLQERTIPQGALSLTQLMADPMQPPLPSQWSENVQACPSSHVVPEGYDSVQLALPLHARMMPQGAAPFTQLTADPTQAPLPLQ